MKNKYRINLKTILTSRLGRFFLIWLMLLAFIPLLVFSFLLYNHSRNLLKEDLYDRLKLIAGLAATEITDYFQEAAADIRHLSGQENVQQLLISLRQEFAASGLPLEEFVHTSAWNRLFNDPAEVLTVFQQDYAYENIYLISPRGDILFAASETRNLGRNLFKGDLGKTRFSQSCNQALKTGAILYSDQESFSAESNQQQSFLLRALIGKEGARLGILALQLENGAINYALRKQKFNTDFDISLVGPDNTLRGSTYSVGNQKEQPQVLQSRGARELAALMQNPSLNQNRQPGTEKFFQCYLNHRGDQVIGMPFLLDIYEVQLGLLVEIECSKAFQTLKEIFYTILIAISGTFILVLLVSLLLTRQISSPIIFLTDWIKNIVNGDLTLREIAAPQNEIGDMHEAFTSLIESTREFATVCQTIALGDCSCRVTIRSEYDLMGLAINKIADNYRKVITQAQKVAAGDYTTNFRPESEKDELGKAINNMISSLRYLHNKNNNENWLKTGINELTKEIQGTQQLEILCDRIIRFVCMYLNIKTGILYVSMNNHLELVSSYALSNPDSRQKIFQYNEGLIGQNAREKKIQIINDFPAEYMEIKSGMLNKIPAYIVLVPLVYEKSTVAVLELGLVEELSEQQLTFLKQVATNIATSLNLTLIYDRLQESLEHSEKQKLQLQNQSEELRVSNEELEEQTIRLQESEKRLQQQQEELRQTNEELEEHAKILKKQKEQLQRKTLEIAETAAELQRMSKYKSEFLANMSHELRTPLNSMLILAKLLSENKFGNLSDKQIEFATTIFSSGNDLLNLINEILDLAKIEANKINLDIQEINIRYLIHGLEEMFRPVADTNGLNFKTVIHKEVPELIVTDDQRLMQILKNLLSNAIKFTAQGFVKLSVFIPKREAQLLKDRFDPNQTIAFEVADSGIGIPEQKQELVFEAFQQVDSGISRKYGGTGLGLSICRELVKLLKGEIKLSSTENQGTRFTVYLPLNLSFPEDHTSEGETAKDKEESRLQHETKNKSPRYSAAAEAHTLEDDRENIREEDNVILIVEDEHKFAEVLLNLTREHGFKGLIAHRGDDALQMVTQYNLSGILLDLKLPGIDGWSVLGRIKDNIDTRHIPVHIISGADKELQGLQMGAIGFLRKPVTLEQLNLAFTKIENIANSRMRRLLIIEDNEDQLLAITNLLEGNDLEISSCVTGGEAYKELQTKNYDCIVLDLSLPDMSGFDLLKLVRMNEDISHIPIIIYTGKSLTDQERYEIREYAETIIVKDADSLELLLDQTALFLHRVENNLSEQKKKIIKKLHNREEIFNGKHILIVDDDMRNVFALSAILEENNLIVDIAKNGKECIEFLHKKQNIDLILMDIMMPVMDGYETMECIRKMDRYSSVPIIALTAKAMKGDKEKCIQSGASDYLAKPVNNDQLLSLLRVWLYKGY